MVIIEGLKTPIKKLTQRGYYPMKKLVPKLILIFIFIGLIFLFKHFDLSQYLTLDYIKANQAAFKNYYLQNQILTIGIFLGVYIVATALSLPGATILTLAAGALFGLVTGVIVVSFASSIGATLAFLSSRFVLRDYVQKKFGTYLKSFNDGVEKDGAFYLVTLRLIPIFVLK